MISEDAARQKLLERVVAVRRGGSEEVVLDEALDRFLERDCRASVASPPFDNSAMDGYAILAEDGAQSGTVLMIAGVQPAGRDLGLEVNAGKAVRIFTGAPLPVGATAVIMQEDVETVADGRIRIIEPVEPGAHIRRAGADVCEGQIVAEAGRRVTPQLIALFASQGMTSVDVGLPPAVAVITTGDEVVAPGTRALAAGEIFNSNGPMLKALTERSGIKRVSHRHVRDQEQELREAVAADLAKADILILAGGVSVGEHDHVKRVLETLGIETEFWRVKVKPGKPFLFGHREHALIFGLPGNPVSSFVTFHLFVAPAIRSWMGASSAHGEWADEVPCVTGHAVRNPGDRPHYVRGMLERRGSALVFRSQGIQESHALYGLSRADALLRVEAGENLEQGSAAVAHRI